jgi:hypothetical protein
MYRREREEGTTEQSAEIKQEVGERGKERERNEEIDCIEVLISSSSRFAGSLAV